MLFLHSSAIIMMDRAPGQGWTKNVADGSSIRKYGIASGA